jgi:hypothetical protein
MIGPLAAHVPYGGEAAEPIGYSPTQLEIRNRQIELTYIWQSNTGTLFSTQPGPAATGYVGPRRYPDDVQPERKEVPAKPSGQPARVD